MDFPSNNVLVTVEFFHQGASAHNLSPAASFSADAGSSVPKRNSKYGCEGQSGGWPRSPFGFSRGDLSMCPIADYCLITVITSSFSCPA